MLYLIIIGVIILMLFYLFKGNLAKPKIDPQNPEQKAQMFEKFEKRLNSGHFDKTVPINYGYYLMLDGETEKARQVINRVFELKNIKEQDNYQARLFLALCEYIDGNYDEALRQFNVVMEHGESSDCYASMGLIYLKKGDLKAALKFNQKAYEYNEDSDAICDNLGTTYYQMGDKENAKKIYEGLFSKKRPALPECYYHYALIKLDEGDSDWAHDLLKTAAKFHFDRLSAVPRSDVVALLKKLDEE